jgi:hypothetical protein
MNALVPRCAQDDDVLFSALDGGERQTLELLNLASLGLRRTPEGFAGIPSKS